MPRYIYDGPVKSFGTTINDRWIAETVAVSEAKAKNNLSYRYKKEHNLSTESRISLSGNIKLVG